MKKLFTLALAMLASVGLWANQTDLISGVTLPDMPTASLDLATQTTFTADDNGWIVFDPYANAANLSTVPTWWKHSAKSTQGQSFDATALETLDPTAPFVTKTSNHFKINSSGSYAAAIRFTGAETASFLVHPRSSSSNKEINVVLYKYDSEATPTQTQIKAVQATSNAFNEVIFEDLTTTLEYVVYVYGGSAGQNGCLVEIALQKHVDTTTPVSEVTIEGPTRGTKDYKSTFTASIDAKADEIKWFVNDAEQTGATDKTFEFTPAAAGDYSIVCKARNANNETDEWIASSPIAFKALNSLSGELIKATLTSGSAATVTGIIGGTADVSLSSNKKMDDGKYFGITLASGSFQEGDTVVIVMTTAGSNYPCLFADKDRTNCLFLATDGSSALEYKIVLPAAATGLTSIYLSRKDNDNYKWNPVLSSMAVIRPMAVKSTLESLTAVTVDDVAISSEALETLIADEEVELLDSYVNAPVVKFTKHVVTTYEDDSQAEKDAVVSVTAEEVAGAWAATATIGGVDYTVTLAKVSSAVVTYMDGETVLGSENVEIGGNPANYTTYQSKSLATFVGWYNDADLAPEHAVTIAEEVINADATYYAKFENAYATSFNFEKAVMENGKTYAFLTQLGTQYYATNITGSLDSLDNSKTDSLRNYAYLGLKVKQSGALLNFRLAAGKTVKVKFGNVAKTPQVSINGGDYANMTITDKVYSHTAEADELISIKMMDGNAVVFQQIAIDEDFAAPELFAINCAEAAKGSVTTAYKLGIPGEKVTLTLTPADGYKVDAVTLNEVAIVPVETVYSFTMPAAVANVAATFVEDDPTAIDNTDAAVKATKRIENGQLFIEKNGVIYNAQGARLQ